MKTAPPQRREEKTAPRKSEKKHRPKGAREKAGPHKRRRGERSNTQKEVGKGSITQERKAYGETHTSYTRSAPPPPPPPPTHTPQPQPPCASWPSGRVQLLKWMLVAQDILCEAEEGATVTLDASARPADRRNGALCCPSSVTGACEVRRPTSTEDSQLRRAARHPHKTGAAGRGSHGRLRDCPSAVAGRAASGRRGT